MIDRYLLEGARPHGVGPPWRGVSVVYTWSCGRGLHLVAPALRITGYISVDRVQHPPRPKLGFRYNFACAAETRIRYG
eukprot:gene12161-biopygen19931